MRRDVVVCADLGAGSMRVGAVTADGNVIATSAAAIRASEPKPGWSTLDAETWWRALRRTVRRTLDQLSHGSRVRGLCLSGLTRTQVFLDADRRPLGPAFLFRDRRAVVEAAETAPHFPFANPADAINAFHPLARIAWFARHQPEWFARVRSVLEPKDFLNFRLTGVMAADGVTYSRFDQLRAASPPLPPWLERCAQFLALPRIAPWHMLGTITNPHSPFDRLSGVPVFAGAMDAWTTAVGAGAIRAGQGYDIAGTSEVAGLVTPTRAVVPGLVSLVWGEDVYHLGGPTQAGADCALWCHQTFRVRGGLASAVERAAAITPGEDRPLFLPYLAGERTPLWRADVRGAFHAVSRGQGPDDFLSSVLEGVAMAVRDIFASAVKGSGEDLVEVRVAGGGANSDGWCQIKADVLGVPVIRTVHRETGLVGAAVAASLGLGWYPNLAAASDAMCRIERQFEPTLAKAHLYAQRAAQYARARQHAIDEANAVRDALPDARPRDRVLTAR